MILCNHQLNEIQIAALEKLQTQCKTKDVHIIPCYQHLLCQYRPLPSNLFYYLDDQLIGFLSTFFFQLETAEISLMVAPNFRQQGIARALFNKILPLLQAQQIKILHFSTPIALNNDWLLARGFQYLNCQYQMIYDAPGAIPLNNSSLSVRKATEADLLLLCAIDDACFPSPLPNSTNHFLDRILDPNYFIFIAEIDGEPIGKAHLHFQSEGGTRLTDLAIFPNHQGCGLGSALLAYCINHSISHHQGTIKLDVETSNQKALRLYSHAGFVVKNACDFWSIPIEVLRSAKD